MLILILFVFLLLMFCLSGHCLSPIKVGPCRGSFPRWHFNAASGVCEPFIFGGCKSNENNYLSKQECSDACNGTAGKI